jgi:RNA polymerase sigma-70 factor (ECF subfamily)
VRWQRTDRSRIKNPAAFLTTTTTHLAINVIQSARHRHETPAELPFADASDATQDPTLRAEQTGAVEEALQALMARLSPAELAAYLLRKAFEYPYDDIAVLLRTSAANARQLVRRAQLHADGAREQPVDNIEHRALVAAFLTGARTGELAELERLVIDRAASTLARHPRPAARRSHARVVRPTRSAQRTSDVRFVAEAGVLSRLPMGSWIETAQRPEHCSAGGASVRPSTT